MDLEDIVEKAKAFVAVMTTKRIAILAIVFASLIGPGFLALYQFKTYQLEHWSVATITLFCLSIGVPSVMVCTVLLFLGGDADDMLVEEKRQTLFIAGACLTALLLYLVHGFLIFVPKPTFRMFVYGAIDIHIMMTFSAVFYVGKERVREWWRRRKDALLFYPQI